MVEDKDLSIPITIFFTIFLLVIVSLSFLIVWITKKIFAFLTFLILEIGKPAQKYPSTNVAYGYFENSKTFENFSIFIGDKIWTYDLYEVFILNHTNPKKRNFNCIIVTYDNKFSYVITKLKNCEFKIVSHFKISPENDSYAYQTDTEKVIIKNFCEMITKTSEQK